MSKYMLVCAGALFLASCGMAPTTESEQNRLQEVQDATRAQELYRLVTEEFP